MDVQNMPQVVPMEDREWFVLFAICVAGKSAKQIQEKLKAFLNEYVAPRGFLPFTPFADVRVMIRHNQLTDRLQKYKMGQYKRIEKAFREVVKLDITKDLTVEKLEAIPGIGPKTARFIVLYTNPDANCVPLDTHILKYLAKENPLSKVPKSTPSSGKKYRQLEILFQLAAKRQGKTVRQLDTEVWESYRKA